MISYLIAVGIVMGDGVVGTLRAGGNRRTIKRIRMHVCEINPLGTAVGGEHQVIPVAQRSTDNPFRIEDRIRTYLGVHVSHVVHHPSRERLTVVSLPRYIL